MERMYYIISLVRFSGRFVLWLHGHVSLRTYIYLRERSTCICYLPVVIIDISPVLLLFSVHCTGKNKYEIIQNFCKTYVLMSAAIVVLSVHQATAVPLKILDIDMRQGYLFCIDLGEVRVAFSEGQIGLIGVL